MYFSFIINKNGNNVKEIPDITGMLHITFNNKNEMLLEQFMLFQILKVKTL